MNIIEQITSLIQQKSNEYQANDPGNYNFWDGHLKYVYREATNLAQEYDADLEIVQLGALLHDIAQIERGEKKDHEIYGREIAERILREYGYPEDRLQRVLGCVLHHRSSKNAENIEELCVADADILAHFDNIPMLFDAAYGVHKMVGLENVRKHIQETFEKDFDDLSERTKIKFEPRYRTIYKVMFITDKNE